MRIMAKLKTVIELDCFSAKAKECVQMEGTRTPHPSKERKKKKKKKKKVGGLMMYYLFRAHVIC